MRRPLRTCDRIAMRPRLGMQLAHRIPAGSRKPIKSLHSRFFNRPDFSCKSANVSFMHCWWPFKEHKSASELNAFYKYDFWPKPVWLVKYISTRTFCLSTSCPQLLETHHFWLCMEENEVCLTEYTRTKNKTPPWQVPGHWCPGSDTSHRVIHMRKLVFD